MFGIGTWETYEKDVNCLVLNLELRKVKRKQDHHRWLSYEDITKYGGRGGGAGELAGVSAKR